VTSVDALVQAMKKIGPPGPIAPQQSSAAVTRKRLPEGPKQPVGTV